MKEVELDDFYSILKPLNTLTVSGRFGVSVNLAEDKQNKVKIAVKVFQKTNVKQVDFVREYNFSYFLSPHPNIIETYEGVYSTSDSFFFVQELCPFGNLKEAMEANGTTSLQDSLVRNIIGQTTSALEFMHVEGLVYRNLRVETILVYAKDLSKIKLSDFGSTRKQGAIVKHMDTTNPYHAPEVCDTLRNEAYGVDKSVDIWALGVLIYYLLRGRYPWTKATIMCKPYWEWEQWLKRKSAQMPTKWSRFSEKALKLFRQTLNPKPKDRCTVKEVKKLLKDKWIKEIKVRYCTTLHAIGD